MRDLHARLITAEIASPDHITRDTTLDGRASVIVATNDRESHIRATLRRDTIEIFAGDGVTQTGVLFSTRDPSHAYCFIAGWIAAHE